MDPRKPGLWPRFQRLHGCQVLSPGRGASEPQKNLFLSSKLCLIGLVRVRSSCGLQARIQQGAVWGASRAAITLPTFHPATLEPSGSASSPLGPVRQGQHACSPQPPALPYAGCLSDETPELHGTWGMELSGSGLKGSRVCVCVCVTCTLAVVHSREPWAFCWGGEEGDRFCSEGLGTILDKVR